MNLNKYIGCLLLVFYSSFAWSQSVGFREVGIGQLVIDPGVEILEVLPGSPMAEAINSTITEIFKSPLHDDLCMLYSNPKNLIRALGVDDRTAKEIFKSCSQSNDAVSPKVVPKKYFVLRNKNSEYALESWTTNYNRTIIYIDDEMTLSSLKQILMHELAISVDAKTNILFSTYQKFERQSEPNQRLYRALVSSTYRPIALSFATLRAFMLEAKMLGKQTEISHEKCDKTFREILSLFQKSIIPLTSVSDDIIFGDLSEMMSTANIPNDLEALLRENLLDPSFVIPTASGKKTFCQYMATPLLTNKSYRSFHANGPRPRTDGGWRGDHSGGPKLKDLVSW